MSPVRCAIPFLAVLAAILAPPAPAEKSGGGEAKTATGQTGQTGWTGLPPLAVKLGNRMVLLEPDREKPKPIMKTTKTADEQLSPDGESLAVTANSSDPASPARVIAVAPVSSGAAVPLSDQMGDNNYGPMWSPDGSRLMYNHFRGHSWYVAIIDKESNAAAIVSNTVDGVEESQYAGWWSRNGKGIWFYDFQNAYQVDQTGKEIGRIPLKALLGKLEPSSGMAFSLSDDGTKLLVGGTADSVPDIQSDEPGVSLIYLYDFESKKSRRVSPKGMQAARPAWLPEGDEFVFEGTTKSGKTSVYRMTPDETKPRLVLNGASQPSVARGVK